MYTLCPKFIFYFKFWFYYLLLFLWKAFEYSAKIILYTNFHFSERSLLLIRFNISFYFDMKRFIDMIRFRDIVSKSIHLYYEDLDVLYQSFIYFVFNPLSSLAPVHTLVKPSKIIQNFISSFIHLSFWLEVTMSFRLIVSLLWLRSSLIHCIDTYMLILWSGVNRYILLNC